MNVRYLGILAAASMLAGCQTIKDWVESQTAAPPVVVVDVPPVPPVPPVPAGVDAVDFALLAWSYGGVNGGGAALDVPRISALKFNGSKGLTLQWDIGLSSWGLATGDAGALACLFVQGADGKWRGGKFDWISTSRSTRDFKNILDGYNGWTLAGVPNPCEAAFVVVSADGRRRSNVIAAEWRR